MFNMRKGPYLEVKGFSQLSANQMRFCDLSVYSKGSNALGLQIGIYRSFAFASLACLALSADVVLMMLRSVLRTVLRDAP